MNTVDSPMNNRLFEAVPYTFKPNLKYLCNPLHNRMPVKLRLNMSVSCLAETRSDENQKLTAKILIEWSEALPMRADQDSQGAAQHEGCPSQYTCK